MPKQTFIFDFDGTIADTYRHSVNISNRLAKEFGYKIIDWDNIDFYKGKTSQEMIHLLKVPILKIPLLLARAKQEFQQGITQLKIFDGLAETLTELKKAGVTLGILSSNASHNIHTVLQNNGLDIFDFVHSTSKIWSKNTMLKRLIKDLQLDPNNIFYIGDETRDIVAAKKIGINIAAVTWGFNSSAALEEFKPDVLIHTPQELLSLVK